MSFEKAFESSAEDKDLPSDSALEKANSYIDEAYSILRNEAARVRKEREAFESVAKKLKEVHFSKTVTLNVGGHHFTTSLHTLKQDPGSMLNAMFSGRFGTKSAEDGSYFIDRDGTHFRFILNYLRTGKLIFTEDKIIRKEILEEAEFYQIQGIVEQLKPKPFEESIIITNSNHRSLLKDWLPTSFFINGDVVMLYRASRDGFLASNFHSSCDDKGATVVVIKAGAYIFGGYTDQSWSSINGHKKCSESFLFSLVNSEGMAPVKMALKAGKEGNGIYCHISYGPTFGGGSDHDLYIANGANGNTNSYSQLNNSYECPPNATYNSFLAGGQSFTVTDVEVFGCAKSSSLD